MHFPDYDSSSGWGCIPVGGLILTGMKFGVKNPKIKKGLGRMQDKLDRLEKVLEAADNLDGSDHGSDAEEGEGAPDGGVWRAGKGTRQRSMKGSESDAGSVAGASITGGRGSGVSSTNTIAAPEITVLTAAGSVGAAGGVGAAVFAPLTAIPAALTTPLWLGVFRVRSDIVIQVGKGVRLIDGRCHFTSGSFGSAFKFYQGCREDVRAWELTSFLEEQRKACESTLTADFPTELSEGMTCLQFYNAWGSARGCCGFVSYRMEGTEHFVVNNAFDRNLYNLSCGVCIGSCQAQSDDAQTYALFALCEKHFTDHGFSGIDFSTDVDGAVVTASGEGFRAEGRMTSFRASTAWFKVTRSRAQSPALPGDVARHCPLLATALNNGHLCSALILALEASSTVNGNVPRGRLTYINGGGGCARKMTVAFFDQTGIPQELVNTDRTVVLPEGAHNILVKFHVIWGSTVKQVDRSHPEQPWIRRLDGSYSEEVISIENGDGVDAYFEVCGTSLHSFVHKAWDFGRDPRAKPREWEWWGRTQDEAVASAVAFLPGASEASARLRLDALRAVLPAGQPEPA